VQIIRRNFALKLLAVSLAIVGWAYFRFATNPIVAAARFAQQISVPITTVNLPAGDVAHFTDHEAVVTVEARRGDPAIKPEEIKALLDLSNKNPGVYNVPVALVAPDVAIQSLSPASVTLTIEKIESRVFPLALQYARTSGQSANVVVADKQVAPASVTVQGSAAVLAQVAAVHLDVALPNEPKQLDEMVRPVAVNAQNAEIGGLQIVPNLVRVQMHLIAGSGGSTNR
jgi:YbbR domain-containing protein